MDEKTKTVHFWTTGPDWTHTVRNVWSEGRVKLAFDMLKGLSDEVIFDILVGVKKLVGGSYEDSTMYVETAFDTDECSSVKEVIQYCVGKDLDKDLAFLRQKLDEQDGAFKMRYGIIRTMKFDMDMNDTVPCRFREGEVHEVPRMLIMPLKGEYNRGVYYCQRCDYKDLDEYTNNIFGFAHSNIGFMSMWECPKCFSIWYCHASESVFAHKMFMLEQEHKKEIQ
jgi:hypothetical protein